MKIIRIEPPKEFKPIVITLESEIEIIKLYSMIKRWGSQDDLGKEIIKKIKNITGKDY